MCFGHIEGIVRLVMVGFGAWVGQGTRGHCIQRTGMGVERGERFGGRMMCVVWVEHIADDFV